jgi:hypothetical protein
VADQTNPGGVPGEPQSELNSSGEARKAILQHILDLTRAKLAVPSRLRLLLSKCNIWSIGRITSREELRQFWRHTKEHLRTGNLWQIQVHKMVQNLWRELKLHTGFAVSFAFNLLPGPADKQIVVE